MKIKMKVQWIEMKAAPPWNIMSWKWNKMEGMEWDGLKWDGMLWIGVECTCKRDEMNWKFKSQSHDYDRNELAWHKKKGKANADDVTRYTMNSKQNFFSSNIPPPFLWHLRVCAGRLKAKEKIVLKSNNCFEFRKTFF